MQVFLIVANHHSMNLKVKMWAFDLLEVNLLFVQIKVRKVLAKAGQSVITLC